jgi:hypothetical protein
MMIKSLAAAGLLSVATLATPAMAQVVISEPGVVGYSYVDGPYVGGYGYRYAPGPGYYYGNRIYPAPRVGAFATAPWVDTGYGYYGYAGYVPY